MTRVARNLKFYPLSLRAAMDPGEDLAFVADTFTVTVDAKPPKVFSTLKPWELLNLPPETILDLPEQLERQCGVTEAYLASALKKWLVQEVGKDELIRKFNIKEPHYLISATKHYSWPKAAGGRRLIFLYGTSILIEYVPQH
jgi:hypothetical protein